MNICKECDREFKTKQALGSHFGLVHKLGRKSRKDQANVFHVVGCYTCKYCKKEFETGSKLGGHTHACKKNPKYKENMSNFLNSQIGRHWSQEMKDHFSKKRIEWLQKNPDKVPYVVNHSSKMSYPEKILYDALELNVDTSLWVYRYRVGIYEYDFAFPSLKIDVEVDGQTHITEKVRKIDIRRDSFAIENGWTVLRFTANDVKTNVDLCVEKIQQAVNTKFSANNWGME